MRPVYGPGPFPALLLLAALLGAEAQSVSGRVTWNGKPVAGARVRLLPPASPGTEVLTDAQGRYSVGVPTSLPRSASPTLTLASRAEIPAVEATGRRLRDHAGVRSAPILGAARPSAPEGSGFRRASGGGSGGDARPAAKSAPAAPPAVEITARGYRDTVASAPSAGDNLDVSLQRDLRRHLWIWGAAPATGAAARDELFAFARRKGIGTLYLDAGSLVRNDKAALTRFLDAARGERFAVELLFGDPHWAMPANHATPVGIAREVAALAREARARGGARPTSIQMDLEPYSLPAWDAHRDSVAEGLVAMYEKLRAALAGTGVGLTACIPRWFDGIPLARGGRVRPLSEWLADVTDRLTLMDYVDHANGVIAGAAGELDYADATGKEVVIGVETVPDLTPESVTFAEEGEAAMEKALEEVRLRYGTRGGYFGIAIHSYKHYVSMKP